MSPSRIPEAATSTRSVAATLPVTRPLMRTTGAAIGPSTTPSAPTVTGASTRTSPWISPSTSSSVAPVTAPCRRVPAATWVIWRRELAESDGPDAGAGLVPRWKIDTVVGEAVGAGNGTRTRDIKLGKLALYQLSYARSMVEQVGI